jgi:hypothetical protein
MGTVLAERLKDLIHHYDKLVFEKTLKVEILVLPKDMNGHMYADAIAMFSPETSIFYRMLGFRDNYVVFSHNLERHMKDLNVYQLESTAIHEVRHRFQCKNPKVMISEEFAKNRFSKGLLDLVSIHVEKYRNDVISFTREYDAHLISWIAWLWHEEKSYNDEFVKKLISCDQNNINDVLATLY